jgi:hypothetical protein
MLKNFICMAVVALVVAVTVSCSKTVSNTSSTSMFANYPSLIKGKWLWYKTITTSSKGNSYDTFYNNWSLTFLNNDSCLSVDAGGTNTNYYKVDSSYVWIRWYGTTSAGKHQITRLDSNLMIWYDRVVYSTPVSVVEYWQYFSR